MPDRTSGFFVPKTVTTLLCVALIASTYPAFILVRWLNTIPNSAKAYDEWALSFRFLSAAAAVCVLVLAVLGLVMQIKPLRVASWVAIPFVALSFVVPVEYLLVLPAALFGAAVVQSLVAAWRAAGEPGTIIRTGVMGVVAFILCVHGCLLLGKLFALGWAKGME